MPETPDCEQFFPAKSCASRTNNFLPNKSKTFKTDRANKLIKFPTKQEVVGLQQDEKTVFWLEKEQRRIIQINHWVFCSVFCLFYRKIPCKCTSLSNTQFDKTSNKLKQAARASEKGRGKALHA